MSKKIIYCCFVLTLAATLGVPSYAGVTVSVSLISPVWPIIEGSTQFIATYAVPNQPQGGPGDPNEKIGENLYEGRGVMQTFTVLIGTGGFTLSDIVITAFGGGNPANPSCTLHLFDLNQAPDNNVGPDEVSYNLAYWDSVPNRYDWFSPSCSFIYPGAPPGDQFITFTFSDYDRIDLEPNHLYTFEIWGPPGFDPGWYWIRSVLGSSLWGTDDPYPGGRAYGCYSDADGPDPGIGPPDLSAERSQLTGDALNGRDMVMAVYGVLADGKAYHPTPRVLEPEADVAPTLTWAPGKWADDTQGHQVWFSTSWSSVNTRSSSANKGRVTNASFSPGTLAFNKRYYWRVDEYNDTPPPTPPDTNTNDSSKYWGGTVWQFVTETPYATKPVPTSGSIAEFKLNSLYLSWTPGAWASETNGHRIYFGTSYEEVLNADTSTDKIYRVQQTETTFDLRNLVPDYTITKGAYYWRIDEVNEGTAGSPWVGPIWNFIMPTYVVVDSFDYASNSELQLMWRTGLQKKEDCAPGLDCVPSGTVTLTSGAMRFDYDNSGLVYCGWSEVKMDNSGLGLGMDWTAGGLVNLASLSIGVDGNIFSGSDLAYDNLFVALEDDSGNIAVVYCDDHYLQKRQFGSVQNWYIPLDDLTNGSPGAVDLTEVNSLYIGIGQRCDNGYNISSTGRINIDNIRLNMPICRTLYSGYGHGCTIKGTQEGDFAGSYFPSGNWSPGDCDVDFYDLDYLSNVWLDSDVTLNYPDAVSPLNDPGHLTVRYEFDETTGSIAYDSSGNSRNATIGNPNPLMWSNSEISGTGCLNLEAGFRTWLDVPTSAYRPDTNGVTFCFWSAYDMNYQPMNYYAATWASVFTMHSKVPTEANANNYNDDSQLIETQVPTPWPPNHEWGPRVRFVDMRGGRSVDRFGPPWAKYSDFGIRWNHYAFTYDDVNKIKAIYQNGQRIAEVNGVNDPYDQNVPFPIWPAPGSFRIGTRSNKLYNPGAGYAGPDWGFWYGKLDDFRVYNYVLSPQEIHYIATKGAGLRTIQLIDPANLSTAGSTQKIDFADYAVFIKNWLKQDFWP